MGRADRVGQPLPQRPCGVWHATGHLTGPTRPAPPAGRRRARPNPAAQEEREPHGSVRTRDRLHPGGHADQVRPRRRRGRGLGAQAARRDARDARHRPRRRRGSAIPTGCGRHRARGHRGRALRPGPRRADGRLLPGRVRLRARGEGRRASCRSAAARAWTRPRSPNLDHDPPAPIMDYVNPPVGGGRSRRRRCKPQLAIPTTSGTGAEATTVAVLDIPDQHVKTRHLAPLPAPASGHRRPRAVGIAAGRGDRLDRPRRRLPRRRVVPLAALRPARPARDARRPPALPGRQPGRRRVVGEGARVRRALPAPRRRRLRRPRGPRHDDARRVDGRRRLRVGGRAHPARLRVSDREPEARVPAARLPRRPQVRARTATR